MKNLRLGILGSLLLFTFTSCYSVFSGGTGGQIVDAESTSVPKAGIANVEVYAYTDSGNRDSDYNRWREGTVFTAAADYYGHTTSGADGSFTINKLVWKENKPDFGKDADFTDIYLLFYHENYGLTKGQTVIISDSTSDTVYVELVAVRKTTRLNLNFIDVATDSNTNNSVYAKISVPQVTVENPTAAPKVYDGTFNGAGELSVSYPRWSSKENKSAGIENSPEITIVYSQSADKKTWKACKNEENNYAFLADTEQEIKKTISNSSYTISLYGKATKLSMPSISGQYINSKDTLDDGVLISMKDKKTNADIGQVTTYAQAVGTSGTEKHGVFSGLGSDYFWEDNSYTGKYSEIEVEITGGAKSTSLKIRNNPPSGYTVYLQ